MLFLLIVFSVSLLSQVVLVPAIASRKGRDGGAWFLLAFFWSLSVGVVSGLCVLWDATNGAGPRTVFSIASAFVPFFLVVALPTTKRRVRSSSERARSASRNRKSREARGKLRKRRP